MVIAEYMLSRNETKWIAFIRQSSLRTLFLKLLVHGLEAFVDVVIK